MPSYGLAVPLLPGKEPVVHEIAGHLKQHLGEYEDSRKRLGISIERAYLQRNPDGSSLVVAYMDEQKGFAESMKALTESDRPIDRYFVDKNGEATGIDFRKAPQGPE